MKDDIISRQAAIEIASEECLEFRGMFTRIEERINNLPSARGEENR